MSGDYVDFKVYDPAMRYVIDSYINANESEVLASFEEVSLLEIIAKEGIENAVEELPNDIKKSSKSTAETIENNIRKLIIDKGEIDPKYYEKMSKILQDLVKKRKEEAIEYQKYLKEIEKLTKKVLEIEDEDSYPKSIDTNAKRAIYNNLEVANKEEMTIAIDKAIKQSRQDAWRENKIKERIVFNAIWKSLATSLDGEKVEESNIDDTKELAKKIFEIVKKHDEY